MSAFIARSHIDGETHGYISPVREINAGIWSLFCGATLFLGLRLWVKLSRKHGSAIWYDDYMLIASWLVLFANDILISVEYATGYVTQDDWDDRMRIMINISSCGTLVGQVMTKTAFGVALLRISNRMLQNIIWFCIVTMHIYMLLKVLLQWGKVCGSKAYDVSWRLDFCLSDDVRDHIKEGGNVYNLIMDFVFAIFPWMITWNLNIGRREKISLCVTLSLGMIIAFSTAARTIWKDDDVEHDEWYFWNNAMSQIWFSSEICGTIIVQCVPILRPFLKEVTPTFQSTMKLSKKSRSVSVSLTKSFKDRQSIRQSIHQSIPLTSMDREPHSNNNTTTTNNNNNNNNNQEDHHNLEQVPSIVLSEDIMRGAYHLHPGHQPNNDLEAQHHHQHHYQHQPAPFPGSGIHVDLERAIPPDEPSPASGRTTVGPDAVVSPLSPMWPFGGERTSDDVVSLSTFSWLNDIDPAAAGVHRGRGLSPPPPRSRGKGDGMDRATD